MTTQFGSYDEDNFEIIDSFSKIQPHFDFDSKFVEVESEYPSSSRSNQTFIFFMIFLLDERNVILDAFALLGGNENLVNQVVDRLEESSFRCEQEL